MKQSGLAWLLLLAAPLAAGQEPPAKAELEPAAEQAEEAERTDAPTAPAGSPAAAGAAGAAGAEERFVPTEKVPADASISFPVDI